jgi:hypothetical protein
MMEILLIMMAAQIPARPAAVPSRSRRAVAEQQPVATAGTLAVSALPGAVRVAGHVLMIAARNQHFQTVIMLRYRAVVVSESVMLTTRIAVTLHSYVSGVIEILTITGTEHTETGSLPVLEM